MIPRHHYAHDPVPSRPPFDEPPISDCADTSRLLNQTPVKKPVWLLDTILNWILGALLCAAAMIAMGAMAHLVDGLFSFGWHLMSPASL